MNDWNTCPLGDIAKVQTGPFGSQLHREDYKPIGTPIITVEHLNDNRITYQNLPLVGDEDKERLSKYVIFEGDIVFSRVGSVDRCAYVSEKEDGWLFSGRLLRVRANTDVINPKFLSYYFVQESFKEHIRRIAVGATMPSINTTILSEVEISYPPRPTQDVITAVLASLDDKIDLLHRQNKTLEALVQTLFRNWFIDGAVEFVELPELVEINPSLRLKKGTVAPYLEMKNVQTDSCAPIDWYEREFNSGTRFQNGDTLMARITPCLENNKVSFVNFLNGDEVGWGSTEFLVLRAKANLPRFYTYLLAKNSDFRAFAIKSMTGSSGRQRVQIESLYGYELGVPSAENLQLFKNQIDPIEQKLKSNSIQIRTLVKLRDTLIPKLMNGDVRVLVPPATHDLDFEQLFKGVHIRPLSWFTRQKNSEFIEISGLQVPIPHIVGLETLQLIKEHHPNPKFEVGKVSNQKKEYILARLGLDAGYIFGPGDNGPYSLDVVKAMELLKSAGLLNWEKQSDSLLEKVWAESLYAEIRGNLLPKLDKYKPIIERTVELFKRIKSTRHAEEVGTILFSFDEIEQEQGRLRPSREEIVDYVLNWKPHWGKNLRKRERIHEAIDLLAEMAFIETD